MKARPAAELVARYGSAAITKTLTPLVSAERLQRIHAVARARRNDVTLLLERFHDPHNGAAVLRSAEAMGLSEVHAIAGANGTDFSIDVSQGAQKWIDFTVHSEVVTACAALKARGYKLVGADAKGAPPETFADLSRVALVMGAERDGLSPEMRARLDGLVAIEMSGFVESFNVSVAAALLMHRTLRARAPFVCQGETYEAWVARYLVQSVHRPEIVLGKLLAET